MEYVQDHAKLRYIFPKLSIRDHDQLNHVTTAPTAHIECFIRGPPSFHLAPPLTHLNMKLTDLTNKNLHCACTARIAQRT